MRQERAVTAAMTLASAAVLALGCWIAVGRCGQPAVPSLNGGSRPEPEPPPAPAALLAPELSDEQLGLVFCDRFERVEKGRFTLPATTGQAAALRGILSGPADVVATPTGKGISLAGKGRVVYRDPAMIDPAEGTLKIRLALGLAPGVLGPNVDFLSLVLVGDKRRATARLYFLPRTRDMIFGVYDVDNRAWVLTIRKNLRWQKDEFHEVKLCWKNKTSLFVDGRIVAARRSEGLLTDLFSRHEFDWQRSALYVGPQKSALRSDFTIDSLKIYNRELKFPLD